MKKLHTTYLFDLAKEGAKARLLALDDERIRLMAFLGAGTPPATMKAPRSRHWTAAQRAKFSATMRRKARTPK